MFKVNNKDTRTTPLAFFKRYSQTVLFPQILKELICKKLFSLAILICIMGETLVTATLRSQFFDS